MKKLSKTPWYVEDTYLPISKDLEECLEVLPHGSGINSSYKITSANKSRARLLFNYEPMSEAGYYLPTIAYALTLDFKRHYWEIDRLVSDAKIDRYNAEALEVARAENPGYTEDDLAEYADYIDFDSIDDYLNQSFDCMLGGSPVDPAVALHGAAN